MLCSKCHEEISKGKGIQLEDSIICKNCALLKKEIGKCTQCHQPIYKGDIFNE